jgi:hypothetical protein
VKPKEVNNGIYPLRFRSLLPAANGGFWMCLQEGGRTSYEAGNKWHSMYEAGPMLVFHFDETGKFLYETYVHKAIVASDDPSGVGYLLLEENGKLHLVYNNASKNWNVKAKKHTDLWFGHTPQSTYKGTNKDTDVVYTVIGSDGKATSEKIIGVNKDAYFLPYLEVVQPRNGAVVMLTGNGDRYRLTKLTLAH